MITTSSSNHSCTSLKCHNCSVIHLTSTPCFQPTPPEHDATAGSNCDERMDNLQVASPLPSYGQSADNREERKTFPVSVEWISNNNQQSLCTSNGNAEPPRGFSKNPRQSHSNANLYDRAQQYVLTPVTAPATADNGTSVTSARVHVRRVSPTMSTCSFSQQCGMSPSSPTTAHPPEIEWDDAATNALYAVSLLQNVGLNRLCNRARNRESMLQSYARSFERRPKVYMARIKGPVQLEKERDSDSNRHPAERHQAKPSKKGRRRRSPGLSQYVCYFCNKVNKQRTNHKRHMIMKHACRLDGTAATAEDIAQARAWASKDRVDRSQQFKSKEYVSSDSDSSNSSTSESSSPSHHGTRSPTRQSGTTDRSSSESSSRSPSPVTTVPPKVRKVRFEFNEPVCEHAEPDRARKRPVKSIPSTSKAPSTVPSILDMNIPVPSPRKIATARRSKKPPTTVRSEVHTATKPPTTKKKAAKSSAVTEAQTEAVTPKKRLVIESPRLDQMVEVAKKAVQNLKDKKEFQLPDPEVYRPTFGPAPK